MSIEERIKAFATLGDYLKNLSEPELSEIKIRARNENSWFTNESIALALQGVKRFLNEAELTNWVRGYKTVDRPKTIAIVMAGNIPLVGFHDFLSVLVSGHNALIKLSSKDKFLTEWFIQKLTEIEPRFQEAIAIAEQIKNFDAVIATGSDNSARYFDYYFNKYPHIIRKNRTSVAILTGKESERELIALGEDVFSYFGLGCRNVSKLYVPDNYTFDQMLGTWEIYKPVIDHHKYCNNYDYQKSILLIDSKPFLDNGFIMLQQSEKLVSPISVLYYEYYSSDETLKRKLESDQHKIQVIIGTHELSQVPFGKAQSPGLQDYADHVDTMKFLSELK